MKTTIIINDNSEGRPESVSVSIEELPVEALHNIDTLHGSVVEALVSHLRLSYEGKEFEKYATLFLSSIGESGVHSTLSERNTRPRTDSNEQRDPFPQTITVLLSSIGESSSKSTR